MLKNLRLLRQKHGISQQALGTAIGVTQQSINKYENHNIEPDINTLKLLADYFDTSIDYIVGHTDVDHRIDIMYREELDKEEYNHMQSYRKLDRDEKVSIGMIMKNYLKPRRVRR